MDRDEIDRLLRATLEDRFLSRSEKRQLKELPVLDDADALAYWRHRAFALAREELGSANPAELVDWLEEVSKALLPRTEEPAAPPGVAEAHFSPGVACRERLHRAIESARRSIDVCVFTITDDRLSKPLARAHLNGIRVRVISDNLKADDTGSDVDRLRAAGLDVHVDRSDHHMHHKFAVFDGALLATGSYNWTRSAADFNQENLLVTDDPRLVEPHLELFERLWTRLST